ncbi:MAG: thioredoxin fold domain-containing protein [Pseudomonadota bacterium]
MTTTASLQQTSDLQQLGKEISDTRKPLLLMFSQHHCPFCKTLKSEVIEPMLQNPAYRERLLMRELMIDYGSNLVDFSGKATTGIDLFENYRMVVTPTIILVDSSGKEIAKRQTGVNTVEMYGWYLDQAIDEAVLNLRKP